jgi:hypothetical protein
MIEMLDIRIDNAIAYRVGGKITEDEMRSVLSFFEEKITAGEKVLIYQEIISIGGVEIDAIIEKLKFFREFGMSNIGKIAVVTNKEWMTKIVDFEGKLFKKFEMKGFSMDEKDQAIDFLKGDG